MPPSDMQGGVQGTPARPSAGPSAGPSSSQKQLQHQQQQAVSNFGFPAVGAKDLAKLLSGEMQANVTAEEISNPNATVAHKCFIAFLEGLSGVSSEFIQRQTTRAVGQMEYKVSSRVTEPERKGSAQTGAHFAGGLRAKLFPTCPLPRDVSGGRMIECMMLDSSRALLFEQPLQQRDDDMRNDP